MSSDCKSTPRIFQWLILLGTMVIVNAARGEGIELSKHPVLQRYPSREDIAQQIRQFRADHPGAVEDILLDFDVAIRSSLTLKAPPTALDQRLHVPRPEVTMGYTRTRASLEREIEGLRSEGHRYGGLSEAERLARAEFYEAHFDEFVVEDRPQLGLVMMYVLAFGWQDWSGWDPQNERLNKAREKFPDLHRFHALVDSRAMGLLLRIGIDEADPLSGSAISRVRSIANEDVLQFYIDWALDPATSNDKRWELWTEIQMIMGKGNRGFWERYLDSDVPTLCYCAQRVFDRPLPEDRNWLDKAQAEWNYQHERDPKVRRAIEIRRQIAEIRKDVDPVTNRISMEQWAEIQAFEAELKRLKEPDEQPDPPGP